ncbi:MAG: hypothetical protein KDN19_15430, partial [Verrucomicrobiae bacterium]|nr:hypothetical protein [Verrucomicrobiae bacterium]
MNSIITAADARLFGRRDMLRALGATASLATLPSFRLGAAETDSLPMQFYKSLSEEQLNKICLPVHHAKR